MSSDHDSPPRAESRTPPSRNRIAGCPPLSCKILPGRTKSRATVSGCKQRSTESRTHGYKKQISPQTVFPNRQEEYREGRRLTNRHLRFGASTIKNVKEFQIQFREFQQNRRKQYDFDYITFGFYEDFFAFFNTKQYSPNTTERMIKHLKIIMRAAREEGLHANAEIERRLFWVSLGTPIEQTGTNITDKYAQWFRLSCALASEFGEAGGTISTGSVARTIASTMSGVRRTAHEISGYGPDHDRDVLPLLQTLWNYAEVINLNV
ncbi:phage integrase SAM-like domain-containing protein [Rikenella microfusus]|uniref:phage integrase SAM-like domain-containing protein n=1 Tax=Rikenella microfusus TaxID=28139 RepID=UPI001D397A07|nr:phage integrase SAM-like domain-containing protein [Rikenella microfusus]HJE88287.1 phage integrase SAM-like domain-containing protein [Rikenella microfusus]